MNADAELRTQKEMIVALASVMRCLISELEKKGLVDGGALIKIVQKLAITQSAKGDEVRAKLMLYLSEYILKIPNHRRRR